MELAEGNRVFIKLGFTDMRKQINGLSALVQILYWDPNGFCLWLSRVTIPPSFGGLGL